MELLTHETTQASLSLIDPLISTWEKLPTHETIQASLSLIDPPIFTWYTTHSRNYPGIVTTNRPANLHSVKLPTRETTQVSLSLSTRKSSLGKLPTRETTQASLCSARKSSLRKTIHSVTLVSSRELERELVYHSLGRWEEPIILSF